MEAAGLAALRGLMAAGFPGQSTTQCDTPGRHAHLCRRPWNDLGSASMSLRESRKPTCLTSTCNDRPLLARENFTVRYPAPCRFVGGVNRPKLVDCYDSHGHRHKQLVSLQELRHIST